MAWALLVVGAISAALVANAFLPVRRNVVLFLPSFLAASLTIELAWLQLAVGLVAGALLVLAGALESWIGWTGLVLLVGSWVALLVTVVW
jgi:hypothetical protein